MFSTVEVYDQNTKFILPLDAIDLACLPIYRQRDKGKTVPLWTPQHDNKYYEFEVLQISQESDTENSVQKHDSSQEVDNKLNLRTYIKIISSICVSSQQKLKPLPFNLKVIDDETLEIHIENHQRVCIPVQNFHGYNVVGDTTICRLCRTMTGQKEMHKLNERHMELIMAPITDNHCIREIDQLWSHCILCNEIIESKEFHITCSPIHNSKLLDAIAASNNVSNYVAINNGAKKINMNSTVNNKLFSSGEVEPSKPEPVKNINVQSSQNLDLPATYCKICDVNFNTNYLTTHLNSKRHQQRKISKSLPPKATLKEVNLHENVKKLIAREKAKNDTIMMDEKSWNTKDILVLKSESNIIQKIVTENTRNVNNLSNITAEKKSGKNTQFVLNKLDSDTDVNDRIKKLIAKKKTNSVEIEERNGTNILSIKTKQTQKNVLEQNITLPDDKMYTTMENKNSSNKKMNHTYSKQDEKINAMVDNICEKMIIFARDLNDVNRKSANIEKTTKKIEKSPTSCWFTEEYKDLLDKSRENKDQSDNREKEDKTWNDKNIRLEKHRVVDDKNSLETKDNKNINEKRTEQRKNSAQDNVFSTEMNKKNLNNGKYTSNDEALKAEAYKNEPDVKTSIPKAETISKSSYKLYRQRENTSGESINEYRRSLILKLVKKSS